MICEQCGQSAASVHFTEVVGSQKRERQLCLSCAEAEGLYVQGSVSDGAEPPAPVGPTPAQLAAEAVRCARCQCSLDRIRRSGRVGCPDCYDTFADALAPLIEQAHGCREHIRRRDDEAEDVRE